MKTKKIFITLILLILISFNFVTVLGNDSYLTLSIDDVTSDKNVELNLTAKSALLMDNRTNKIIYSKNENEKMYPASTTKILTAILVLENSSLDNLVTASYNAVMSIPNGYSTAHLQIGEQLTVEQLLQLLLVHSANDAANVLAEYVGGSVDSFVSMMNTKLNELGLKDSHFTNTYGLHDDNHYTTAHDLAYIMKYCMKNEDFRRLAGSASCSIPATNMYGTRLYSSTNELLNPNSKYYYSHLTAGKTGFTSQAKGCLVSCGYKDDLELICVVLGSENDYPRRFDETKYLYEYGYSNYLIKNIVEQNSTITQIQVSNATKDTKNLDLLVKETIPALIKNSEMNNEITPEISLNEDISAPIEEGTILGKIKYTVDGVSYSTDLVASHYVEKTKILNYISYVVLIIIVIFLLYRILFHKNKKYKY